MLVKNYTTGKCYFYSTEITTEKYAEIVEKLKKPPEAPEGYSYALNAEFEWELCELPVILPTDADYAEAGKILLGVSQ